MFNAVDYIPGPAATVPPCHSTIPNPIWFPSFLKWHLNISTAVCRLCVCRAQAASPYSRESEAVLVATVPATVFPLARHDY